MFSPRLQLVEVVRLLRVMLLEFTDTALQQAGRRSQQLVRAAAERAQVTLPPKNVVLA